MYYSLHECREILNIYENSPSYTKAFERAVQYRPQGLQIVKLDDLDKEADGMNMLLVPLSGLYNDKSEAKSDEIFLGKSENCVQLTNEKAELTRLGKLFVCAAALSKGHTRGEGFQNFEIYSMCVNSMKQLLTPKSKKNSPS